MEKPKIAIIAPEFTRSDPEGAFIRFLRDNADNLRNNFQIIATEGTYRAIIKTGYFEEGEHIICLRPGAHGGIVEIACQVVDDECKVVIFLYDPEEVRSEAPETRALSRVCIYKQIPFLTTVATADYWLKYQSASWLKEHGFGWSDWLVVHRGGKSINPLVPEESTIALIAHNNKKEEMREFVKENLELLRRFKRIIATKTTGTLIKEWFYFDSDFAKKIECKESGPKGGDVQIAKEILEGQCQVIIFLQDPLTAQPHDPDINLLRRTCQLPDVSPLLLSDSESAKAWAKSVGGVPILTLAEKLRKKFKSLKEVLVIPEDMVKDSLEKIKSIPSEVNGWGRTQQQVEDHDKEWKKIMGRLARVTALYLDTLLRREDNEKIAITVNWGRAMAILTEEIKKMNPSPIPKLDVLPMTGQPGVVMAGETTNEIAGIIARAYGAKSESMGSSIFAEAPQNPIPKENPELWKKLLGAKIVITSMGGIPPDEKYSHEVHIVRDPTVGEKVVKEAIPKKAIGDIGPILFNEDGEEVKISLTPVGLQYENLKRIAEEGRVILMVGGDERKYKAIEAALKGRLCSVLITDPETARNLLLENSCLQNTEEEEFKPNEAKPGKRKTEGLKLSDIADKMVKN